MTPERAYIAAELEIQFFWNFGTNGGEWLAELLDRE
jgi:hypothetical protein